MVVMEARVVVAVGTNLNVIGNWIAKVFSVMHTKFFHKFSNIFHVNPVKMMNIFQFKYFEL